MAYQELVVANAVKAGLYDSDSRGAVWDNTGLPTPVGDQGMKFANDGKTILIVKNDTAITDTDNLATWDTAGPPVGDYDAKLEKKVGAGDSSIHFQFDPTKIITFGEFCTNVNAGTVYSFNHKDDAAAGNYAQWEFRFQDPASYAMGVDHGWIEVTTFPCQGLGGGESWKTKTLSGTTGSVYCGRTPDGTGADDLTNKPLSDLVANVGIEWNLHEPSTGEGVANYVMERVRFELWEGGLGRTCHIDTVVLDGDAYPVEPGMAGAKLGPSLAEVKLEFVEYRDRYGRLETLAPLVGAKQTSIVGPLLPALFNDSAGYVKFKPDSDTTTNVRYSVIRVDNPS